MEFCFSLAALPEWWNRRLMFSDRFNWDLGPNALSLLVEKKRSRGESLFDLTASNPTRVGLTYDSREILGALALPQAMRYEPDPRGLKNALQAIADYYEQQGASVHPDAVFLTASTSDAYSILFKLLGNPGDEILIPRPGYPLLAHLAGFEGLLPYSFPLRYEAAKGWSFDLEVIEALITPRTRAIVLVNPNNPTGSYIKDRELSVLGTICRRHDLALIVDEVFSDFAAPDAPGRVQTAIRPSETLTFVLNGFSKMLALPQVKLAWIVVSGESESARAARMHLETILDFYLSVATPIQHGAERLLRLRKPIQNQILSRIDENIGFLEEKCRGTDNCRMLLREGGWYAIVEITDAVSDEERAISLLAQDNTLVHPGFFYEFHREGFVVVSLLPSQETFHTGISRLIRRFGRR